MPAGRPKKYPTAQALERAIEGYFASISYRKPVIITTPTGEVDEKGRIKHTTRMLTEGPDGMGKPRTVVKYVEEPTLSGLCLYLGVSRSTWAGWLHPVGEGETETSVQAAMRQVAEAAKGRIEARLEELLTSRKHVQGIIFNLKNNYGWKDRQDLHVEDGKVEVVLAPEVEELAQ